MSRDNAISQLIGETEPVQPVYKLIDKRPTDEIIELYSKQIGHILLTDASGQTATINSLLATVNEEMAFPEVHNAQSMIMTVPKGTKKLSKNLRHIMESLGENGDVFERIGFGLKRLYDGKIGLPLDDQPLDRLAWAPDYSSHMGIRVLLVPPYDIQEPTTLDDGLVSISKALEEEGVGYDQRSFVIERIQDGWSSIG